MNKTLLRRIGVVPTVLTPWGGLKLVYGRD